MFESTTTLVETAIVVGSTATTGSTAVKIERDEEGEIKDVLFNKKRAIIGTALSTTAVSATNISQEISYRKVLDNIANAQTVIESMSDEELAEFESILCEKDFEFSEADKAINETEKTECKTYIKK